MIRSEAPEGEGHLQPSPASEGASKPQAPEGEGCLVDTPDGPPTTVHYYTLPVQFPRLSLCCLSRSVRHQAAAAGARADDFIMGFMLPPESAQKEKDAFNQARRDKGASCACSTKGSAQAAGPQQMRCAVGSGGSGRRSRGRRSTYDEQCSRGRSSTHAVLNYSNPGKELWSGHGAFRGARRRRRGSRLQRSSGNTAIRRQDVIN
jgi:hypothetical protein